MPSGCFILPLSPALSVIFTCGTCSYSRMFKGSHTGSLPGASLVFFSMNLWTSSRPFPELPLEGRDRKLLAASNNISTSGSWEAAYLLLYQIQTMEGCLPYAQDGITCNHLDHVLLPPTNLGAEPHSLGLHSFVFLLTFLKYRKLLGG